MASNSPLVECDGEQRSRSHLATGHNRRGERHDHLRPLISSILRRESRSISSFSELPTPVRQPASNP
jgi:hypothetical protein